MMGALTFRIRLRVYKGPQVQSSLLAESLRRKRRSQRSRNDQVSLVKLGGRNAESASKQGRLCGLLQHTEATHIFLPIKGI